jgi:AraC family transcriptional regulator of adaptative response/methylated-DNA-[protein]-cysteine methyltransferase
METAGVTRERATRETRAAALAQRYASLVADACRVIARSPRAPSLRALAAGGGLSPHHFHRVFRAVTGLTPRGYAEAHRANRTRVALSTSETVTDAIYEAGFASSGRFYEKAPAALGMTPRDFRARGRNVDIEYDVAPCALGVVLVARTTRGICAVMLGDSRDALADDLKRRFSRARFVEAESNFRETLAAVVQLIEAPTQPFSLPLDLHGTIFQERVWRALRDITPGTTITYGDLAARIGAPSSVRAVARACGANPVAVVVPCHRVVGKAGGLTGYRWGLERKATLLAREQTDKSKTGRSSPAGGRGQPGSA